MINTSKDTIAHLLRESYDRVLEFNGIDSVPNLVVSHFGNVDQELIESLTAQTEEKLLELGEHKSTIKKVFAVFIEALQNVYNHGSPADDVERLGGCIILQGETEIFLHFMNLVDITIIPKMKTFLDRLNSMNKEETKELYMETLSNGVLSEKGGAGLGYMTMRLKSLNPIEYQFTDPIDDKCGFHYFVKIERKL